MRIEPQHFSAVFISLFVASIVSAILWRRQRTQRRTVGMAKTTVVFLVAALAALAWLTLIPAALRQAGIELGRWLQQANQIAAALVAYILAGRILGRLQKHRGNAHQAAPDR